MSQYRPFILTVDNGLNVLSGTPMDCFSYFSGYDVFFRDGMWEGTTHAQLLNDGSIECHSVIRESQSGDVKYIIDLKLPTRGFVREGEKACVEIYDGDYDLLDCRDYVIDERSWNHFCRFQLVFELGRKNVLLLGTIHA